MKIIRHDQTGFEALQSKIGTVVCGALVALAGLGVVALVTLRPAGTIEPGISLGLVLGIVAAIVGLVAVVTARSVRVSADTATRMLTLRFCGFLGEQVEKCGFDDVVRITEGGVTVGRHGHQRVVEVLLKNGATLTIPVQQLGLTLNGLPIHIFQRRINIGQALATVMNVPFEAFRFSRIVGAESEAVGTKPVESKDPLR
jgi:hypothetical protein